MTDAEGVPLVVKTTRANVNDCTMAIELLDAIPSIPGVGPGRPRFRPTAYLGDHIYGTKANLAATRARGVHPLLGKPRGPHGSGLGKLRYVVERTLSWFGNFRRLKICYEREGEHFQAMHDLAAALICERKVRMLHG